MSRRTSALLAVVGVLLAAGGTVLVLRSDHEANKAAFLSLALTVGLSFLASGTIALWRRPDNRTGLLLVAVSYFWFVGALTESNDDWAFTIGLALNSVLLGAFVHLLLAFPTGRLERLRDRVVVLTSYAVVVAGNLAQLLTQRTPQSSCPECESTIAITDGGTAGAIVNGVFTAVAVVLVTVILVLVVGRFRRASGALRRALGPVLGSGALVMAILLVQVLVERVDESAAEPLYYVFLVVFAMVPVAFLAGILRSRLARSAVGGLLLELGRGVPLRDALAHALQDPTLDVVYWVPGQDRFVWHDGTEFHDDGGPRLARYVERNGQRVGAFLHDPTLADETELIDAVAAAAGLWLDNERLQASLRAQVAFLETTVDTSPSLLCSLAPDGSITHLNLAALHAAGHERRDDVRGRDFWDVFVAPAERAESRAGFDAAAPEHASSQFERTFVNAAGEERTIAWSTAPLHDDRGELRTIICGGLDITVRRRRERELEVERDFANTVADTIPVILIGVYEDAVVNPYGPNPAFEDTLGWTSDEAIGRSLLDFVHPDDRYLAGMAIASAANGVPAPRRESRWLHKDGSERILAWSAREILGLEGRTVVLVSGADVSERHRQEEEIRASRARIVAAGDEARRRLERNLHDGAQQRLVALSLSLRLAQSKLDTDPGGAHALLELSRAELAAALDELRELARGIHPAVLTDRGLTAALEALAARLPVPVELDTPAERLPAQVEAAAYYVVAEALANVIKYAAASVVSVAVARDDGCVRVLVTDDGVGGADESAGSGLRGLADRVAALEGSFTVDSPPGGGTRVAAEIPLAPGLD